MIVIFRCGKPFVSKEGLEKHVKVIHEKTKDFKCLLCPKTFSFEQYLQKHVANVSIIYSKFSRSILICYIFLSAFRFMKDEKITNVIFVAEGLVLKQK